MLGAYEKRRGSIDEPRGRAGSILPVVEPEVETQSSSASILPAAYVIIWIGLSSILVVFNKWILDTLNFHYPVTMITYHLVFSTVGTQLLARYTTLLDKRKNVKMTGRLYLRSIFPIGLFFSLSLICGNMTYLYLSVAFIQMLKALAPVAVLLTNWAFGVSQPNMTIFINVMTIVVGVAIASYGETEFVLIGFLYQMGGIIFEAIRLTMVHRLLSSDEHKMDPLVSLYYFAPVCAVMNFVVALFLELPYLSMSDIYRVGLFTLFLNGLCAFMLNVSSVLLIGKTSSLVLTLCGVLKDVFLVFASIAIWGTQVTSLQFFGYSIAVSGMTYYEMEFEALSSYPAKARHLAESGLGSVVHLITTACLSLWLFFS